MHFLEKIQKAVKQESAVSDINGWLFTDFAGRDSLSLSLLHLPPRMTTTRRWLYIVLKTGMSVKIVHAVEPHILDALPSDTTYTYSSQRELLDVLQQFAGQTFAVQCDADIPVISTVDGGFIQLLKKTGIHTATAAPLIQRCRGILSPAGIASHERAAALLYKTVSLAWNFVCECYACGRELTEGDAASFILEQFLAYGLTTDHAPIVAFGAHTADPHYAVPPSGGAHAQKGDIIQFDLWAKENIAADDEGNKTPDAAVYADISWVGIYGTQAPAHIEQVFRTLCTARDSAARMITESAEKGLPLTGYDLDIQVRSVLADAGFASYIKHRTGHGIDVQCHGSGVNLDSAEFPDKRLLLPGSCFSVEPGLYFDDFGMRTELNIYITQEGFPVVSGMQYGAETLKQLPSFPQQQFLFAKDFTDDNHH